MPHQETVKVRGIEGRIFHGLGKEPEVFAFVPESLLIDEKLDENLYRVQGWTYLNNTAQKTPRGSHVWPDMSRPADPGDPAVQEFLERIQKPKTRQRKPLIEPEL